MIQQSDIDHLQAGLEQLRDTFFTDRAATRQTIAALQGEAQQLLSDPEPGKMFDSVQHIDRLLDSLHRNVTAQRNLEDAVRSAA